MRNGGAWAPLSMPARALAQRQPHPHAGSFGMLARYGLGNFEKQAGIMKKATTLLIVAPTGDASLVETRGSKVDHQRRRNTDELA